MNKEEEELIVDGYRFATLADAETARMEIQRIEHLENHLNYKQPQNVLLVYNKAIENKVFMTPIGLQYLQSMQEKMVKWGILREKIQPVPFYATFTNKTANNQSIRRSVEARRPKPEYKSKFITSLLINILLVVLVGAMFVITLKSDNPNILNYRTAVLNEYSQWEQELTQREKAVRQAERELDITP